MRADETRARDASATPVASLAAFVRDLITLAAALGGGSVFFVSSRPPTDTPALVFAACVVMTGTGLLSGFLCAQKWELRIARQRHIKRTLRIAIVTASMFIVVLVTYVVLLGTYTSSLPRVTPLGRWRSAGGDQRKSRALS